jgi:2-polyprenyl-3-methyl-5-hydroxy-6-metoxy-1,4-benzoquinol methylase
MRPKNDYTDKLISYWSVDIRELPWTDSDKTNDEIRILLDKLTIATPCKILDLACGYGRHSIELAKMRHYVEGIDLVKKYIDYGNALCDKLGLSNCQLICDDVLSVNYENMFDIVLVMCEGPIGYFKDEAQYPQTV